MIKVWTFDEFVSAEILNIPYLVDPLVPAQGITLLHGPAGAGKSALGFYLLDVLGGGKDFLGLNTLKTSSLYVNLEMPLEGLRFRLSRAGFKPSAAYLINHPPLDLLQPGFNLTPIYTEVRSFVKDLEVGCVIIDNLGCLIVRSTTDDDVARRTVAMLREWFDDRAVVLIHHNRKMRFNPLTGGWASSDEDAAGSKYWVNSVASVIHVLRENSEVRVIRHTKSQVMRQHEGDIKFALGDDGVTIIPWDKKKADDIIVVLTAAEMKLRQQHPDWGEMSETQRVELIAKYLNKSTATIYRWKASAEVKKEAGDEK